MSILQSGLGIFIVAGNLAILAIVEPKNKIGFNILATMSGLIGVALIAYDFKVPMPWQIVTELASAISGIMH